MYCVQKRHILRFGFTFILFNTYVSHSNSLTVKLSGELIFEQWQSVMFGFVFCISLTVITKYI